MKDGHQTITRRRIFLFFGAICISLFFSVDTKEIITAQTRDSNTASTSNNICNFQSNFTFESQVIALVNAERAKLNLGPLHQKSQLTAAARLHSEDMACNNFFSHTGSNDSSPFNRITNQGYFYSYAGENIAAGYSTPEAVMAGWMNSPGHKANILNANYTDIGVGYAYKPGTTYGAYWTQSFGSRQSYTISGKAGLTNGVTINYTNETTNSILTDANGNYSFVIPIGWSGTVTPSHDCYSFNPPSRSYSNVQSNKSIQDFTATQVCDIIIKRDTTSPTAASQIVFTVMFVEDVTGINTDGSDFVITKTGSVTGESITNVQSISPSVYKVTVNTGTGNGTIRLDIPESSTITNLSNNDITGLPYTTGEIYAIIRTQTFLDVPSNYWSWNFIERLALASITGGCGGGNYCPANTVTRDQMAVFLLRGIYGSSYTPPAVEENTGFNDVPVDHWAAAWIKQLAAEGITTGCGGGNYCPRTPVTRDQMAVFLLRAKYGSGYNPPMVGNSTNFNDVPTNYWAAAWIKQLAAEGVTTGCGNWNYCPATPVTRDQMAVFLVRAFNLP